jgi:hypothetical protein
MPAQVSGPLGTAQVLRDITTGRMSLTITDPGDAYGDDRENAGA